MTKPDPHSPPGTLADAAGKVTSSPEASLEQEGSTATRRARRRAMALSLAVAVLMLVGKLTAAAITGSTAIFSDAAESVIHIVATGFATFSLWYAATPPDTDHLYGHGKIAYFAAAVEGILILVAAAGIMYSAIMDVLEGPSLEHLGTGLYIIAGLTAVNAGLGWYLVRTGRRYNSLVLVSNGQHVLTDMWTSVGVVVGVALVWATGIVWFDPLVAVLVALNILWTAVRLLRRAAQGLMERADPEATQALLDALEEAEARGTIAGFHQVRHRRVNDQIWVDLHLTFPSSMSITEAHARSHQVEDSIQALFPQDDVYVTAHLEPHHHDEAHPDGHAEPTDPLREISSSAS